MNLFVEKINQFFEQGIKYKKIRGSGVNILDIRG
jgi:hypothetical protein